MKKIILYVIGIILILCISLFTLTGKKNNKELKTIKVGEVTHSIFYTPFYVSIEKNYFKDYGIDIDLSLISGANNVVSAVLSNEINVGFCGPEATIYVYKGGEKDYIKSFAGLTKRDGQFILSRTKNNNFKFSDLIGKEVLAGRIAGMPELNFENALLNEKIKKEEININTSVDFASLSSAFISGEGDYVNLFEPNATKMEEQGFGFVVASIGEKSGTMPYTTFNAKKSFIKKNKQILTNFTKALDKGIKFTKENDSKTIAKSILKQFPDTSLNDLIKIIDRYKNADTWLDNPYIEEDLFKNLEDLMINSNQLDKYVNYNDLINNLYTK